MATVCSALLGSPCSFPFCSALTPTKGKASNSAVPAIELRNSQNHVDLCIIMFALPYSNQSLASPFSSIFQNINGTPQGPTQVCGPSRKALESSSTSVWESCSPPPLERNSEARSLSSFSHFISCEIQLHKAWHFSK